MPKFLIKYNYGYGEEHDVVDAPDQTSADGAAYDAWKDGAESQADYSAKLLTPELAEEYGFDMEDYE